MKKTANYDMDFDDEEWLAKLNNEVNLGRELLECITPEKFELVIDALERGVHCNHDECLDEQADYDLCMHLERKEAVEVVRKYWIRKRKQNQRKYKRSALVKVFQLYQPRRSQVIPYFFSRKNRSLKRQASQGGRGKQGPLLRGACPQ